MTAVLNKPADRIDAGDIQALIDESVPEGAQIEFKETLPAGKGKTDRWLNGGSGINDYARNRILEEVAAFANAYGGALVLGVAESSAKPSVAEKISPLPRCADLAERFRLVFRDCVEPQLPALDIVPVPTAGDNGVLVLRTGRSHQGPHRVIPTMNCPIRRFDRCESLSMREIQDMTLNLARGTEKLERRLKERSVRFEDEFKRLETPDDAFGFRVTAVPVGDEIQFDTVYLNYNLIEELHPPSIAVKRDLEDRPWHLDSLQNSLNLSMSDWRPMLRSARKEVNQGWDQRVERFAYIEIHADGLVEIGYLANRIFEGFSGNQEEMLSAEMPVSSLAQLLVWANHLRNIAHVPSAEYIFQIQFNVTAEKVHIKKNLSNHFGKIGYLERRSSTTFPFYILGNSEEIAGIISMFEKDFWNYVGMDIGDQQGMIQIVKS